MAAYTAMDPEEEDITWSLSGDDMDDFSIEAACSPSMIRPTSRHPKGRTGDHDNEYNGDSGRESRRWKRIHYH